MRIIYICLIVLYPFCVFSQTITLQDGGINITLEMEDSTYITPSPLGSDIEFSAYQPVSPNQIMAMVESRKRFYMPLYINFSSSSFSVKSSGSSFILSEFAPASSFFSESSTNSGIYQYPIPANYTNIENKTVSLSSSGDTSYSGISANASFGVGYDTGRNIRVEFLITTPNEISLASSIRQGSANVELSTGVLDIKDLGNNVVATIEQTDSYSLQSQLSASFNTNYQLNFLAYKDFSPTLFFENQLSVVPYIGGGIIYQNIDLTMSNNVKMIDNFNGKVLGVSPGYADVTYSGVYTVEYNNGLNETIHLLSPTVIFGATFTTVGLARQKVSFNINLQAKYNINNTYTFSGNDSLGSSNSSISNVESSTRCNTTGGSASCIPIDTGAIGVTESGDAKNLKAQNNSIEATLSSFDLGFSIGATYSF